VILVSWFHSLSVAKKRGQRFGRVASAFPCFGIQHKLAAPERGLSLCSPVPTLRIQSCASLKLGRSEEFWKNMRLNEQLAFLEN
jgi:hypothetical protein